MDDGVYAVFGESNLPPVIDVTVMGTLLSGFNGDISVASAGDVNADTFDDVLVTDDDGAHLFAGRTRADWLAQQPHDLPATSDSVYDFNDPDFAISVDQGPYDFFVNGHVDTVGETGDDFWEIDDGRLVFGNGSYFNSNNVRTHTYAATSFAGIDLSNVRSATLTFDSFLQTEQSTGFDIASVQISVNGDVNNRVPIPGADNQPGGMLIDGMTPVDGHVDPAQIQSVSISLDAFVGPGSENVRLFFEFNSVDNTNQGFFGWAIDNIRITTSFDDDVTYPGAIDAQGLGDLDGDLIDDFGVLMPDLLEVHLGDPSLAFPVSDRGRLRWPEAPPSGRPRRSRDQLRCGYDPDHRANRQFPGPGKPRCEASDRVQRYERASDRRSGRKRRAGSGGRDAAAIGRSGRNGGRPTCVRSRPCSCCTICPVWPTIWRHRRSCWIRPPRCRSPRAV